MSTRIERGFVLRFLALFSPFAVCLFSDYFLVGRRYFDLASNEAPHFWFGHALAWRDGGLLPLEMHMSHLPAITYNELGALIAWSVQNTADPFASMAMLGLALALLVAAAASLWATVLCGKFELSPLALGAISSLIAVQPALLLFPWSSYYILGCLLLPLGFGIALILEGRDLNNPSVIAVPYILGFAATMHFAALQVAVALLAALFVALIADPRRTWQSWNQLKLVWPEPVIVALTTLLFVLVTVLDAVYAPPRLVIISSIGWIGVMSAALLCAYRLSFPFALGAVRILVGWLIGANVLYPLWLAYFSTSMASKGGLTRPEGNLVSTLFSIRGFEFLAATPWRWLLWVLAAMATAVILWSLRGRRDDGWVGLRPLNVFTVAVVAIVAISARDAILLPEALALRVDRYLIAAIVAVPTAAIVIWRAWPSQIGKIAAAAIGFAGLGYADYTVTIGPTVAEARAIDRKLSETVKHFLARNPDGKVVCYYTYVPRQCSEAFGYEWYRYLSNNEIAQRKVRARRVYTTPMLGCQSPQNCFGASSASIPLLLIGRDVPTWLSSLGSIEFSYTSLIEPLSEGHRVMVVAIPASEAGRKN